MRTVHLLTGAPPLTRAVCGHSIWSIYPQGGKASAGNRRSGTRMLIFCTDRRDLPNRHRGTCDVMFGFFKKQRKMSNYYALISKLNEQAHCRRCHAAELKIGTHWRPRDDEMPPGSKPPPRAAHERKHKALRFGRSASKGVPGAPSQDAS
jgi:hypothetical protein